MKTRLHSSDLQELLVESVYPANFIADNSGIEERKYQTETIFGTGCYRELFFEGVHIGFGDIALNKPTRLFVESDMETVEMHFTLCGDSFTKNNDTGTSFEFGCNQHNVFYINGFKGISEWSSHSKMQVFEVNLMPSFFEKYLPHNTKAFEDFRRQLYESRQSILCKHNLQITPQMLFIIKEILESQRHDAFKRMFVEAKVIELLMLQLEQISEHHCDTFCSLKKADIEKMYKAKEVILNNLSTPCSLINIAQQVGTNEFTLKKGFKEVFGTTVFGFWNDVKMQEAKRLLLDHSMSVSEVSEQIGYKNPQHFSTAFKKYFGTSPSQLKTY
ncbi:helix-turn-helix transcriptional regulator [Arthrospiribacter ruber]|uniref:AraC family transcriptional regulator n=1 Tax=Arthrospiribacter ruber TaxID=2487934 RepID=A0A951IYQ3_9BACT|nr:AraC family transcriptional regulator [Arthrospiribacter ruber]MBW3469565.1 AraC family transcriptional regulator [Arthrospiribacter ruber]